MAAGWAFRGKWLFGALQERRHMGIVTSLKRCTRVVVVVVVAVVVVVVVVVVVAVVAEVNVAATAVVN